MHTTLQIVQQEHASLTAMLQSIRMMNRRGPRGKPVTFFEVMRSMLFYIDEYPEKSHHPKETLYLFPAILLACPELQGVINRLDAEHETGERQVRELQHLLLAWEILGESHKEAFISACETYIDHYLEHIHVENTQVLPQAAQHLSEEDCERLDEEFLKNVDPLAHFGALAQSAQIPLAEEFKHLFTQITHHAPAPIGLGDD
jgi:hemerythrin-like domain-containing protein